MMRDCAIDIKELALNYSKIDILKDAIDSDFLNDADELCKNNMAHLKTISYKFNLPSTDNPWGFCFEGESTNSKYLYFFAFDWLACTIYAYQNTHECKYSDYFTKMLNYFFQYIEEASLNEYVFNDHTIYRRTIALINALMIFPDGWELKEKTCRLLYNQAQWAINDQNYSFSNHGLMSDTTLIYTSLLFSKLPFAKIFMDKALKRIDALYKMSFSVEGYSLENSFEYHRYNLNFFTKIINICKQYNITELESIRDNLQKSELVYRYLLLPNGGMSAVGDSSEQNASLKFAAESINESKHLPDAGLSIIKNKDIFISIKSGYKVINGQIAHKHCDDGSITLWYKGENLLVDAGKFNYDTNDPIRLFCQCAGHSMAMPFYATEWSLGDYLKNISGARLDYYSSTALCTSVTSIVDYKDSSRFNRTVTYSNKNEVIEIYDKFEQPIAKKVAIRFLIAPQAECLGFEERQSGVSILLKKGEVYFRLEATSNESQINANLLNGYYSKAFSVAEPCFIVDFVIDEIDCGSVLTTISLGDNELFGRSYSYESSDIYRHYSPVDVDGVQHEDRFGTKVIAKINGGKLIIDVSNMHSSSELDYAYYLYDEKDKKKPLFTTEYFNNVTNYEWQLPYNGCFMPKVFVKRHTDNYKFASSIFLQPIEYRYREKYFPLKTFKSNVFTPRRRMLLTVDVEALEKRSPDDHINKLIYGRINNDVYGIERFMDIADKYNVKMVFFLDFAEVEQYGNEILNVAKLIIKRGHDLQLHLHPVFSNQFWNSHGLEKPINSDDLDENHAEVAVSYIVEQYKVAAGKPPLAFRMGGYKLNIPILNALKKYEVFIDASYNSNRTIKGGNNYQGCFYWDNGIYEIPILVNDPNLRSELLNYELNFNSPNVFPQSKNEFSRKAIHVKEMADTFFDNYGDSGIASLIMHSWSFSKEEPFYIKPISHAAEYFEFLLKTLTAGFVNITTTERLITELPNIKESIVNNNSILVKSLSTCTICGGDKFKTTNTTFPRECCGCGSLERQRALAQLLQVRSIFKELHTARVLHISPSHPERILLGKYKNVHSTTIDIRPELKCDITGDLCKMPQILNDSFDIVLASCVLNHVYNDDEAINEIYRVLSYNGLFITWVELAAGDKTEVLDDPTIWYGKENFEKYKIGTYRRYGRAEFKELLNEKFGFVEEFTFDDKPSGRKVVWYVARKSKINTRPDQTRISIPKDYKSITEALKHLPDNGSNIMIELSPGIYREKVMITRDNISISGVTGKAEDTLICYNDSDFHNAEVSGKTATFTILSNHCKFSEISFINDAGKGKDVGRGLAVFSHGDKVIFENCAFLGWQDTVRIGTNSCWINVRQLFNNCYFEGSVDFIFGHGTAYFNKCVIHSKSGDYDDRSIVVCNNTPKLNAFGYVFNECIFEGGRNLQSTQNNFISWAWRDYSQVFLHSCEFDKSFGKHHYIDRNNDNFQACCFIENLCKYPEGQDAESFFSSQKNSKEINIKSILGEDFYA